MEDPKKAKAIVILAIDPGTRFCGYAIAAQTGNHTGVCAHGCLIFKAQKPLPERLLEFHDAIETLIKEWHIDKIAIETPFLGKNAQNFLKLGYLRGIIYLLAQRHRVFIEEFTPRSVKQQIAGFGGASKEQVACMVHTLLPRLGPQVLREDETDALAIALCCLWKNRIQSAL